MTPSSHEIDYERLVKPATREDEPEEAKERAPARTKRKTWKREPTEYEQQLEEWGYGRMTNKAALLLRHMPGSILKVWMLAILRADRDGAVALGARYVAQQIGLADTKGGEQHARVLIDRMVEATLLAPLDPGGSHRGDAATYQILIADIDIPRAIRVLQRPLKWASKPMAEE